MSVISGESQLSGFNERVVDVMEELVMLTLLTRDVSPYLVDRYSGRRESAQALSKRVNQRGAVKFHVPNRALALED